jgi:cysteine synthase
MNILETIGNTPLVELTRYSTNPNVRIFAKLEGTNPGGSVKDRVAKYLIQDAESKGQLTHDKIIIEATSGNTGIGLAMLAAIKGYKFTAVMPASVSQERIKILEQYGAKVILTDKTKGTNFALQTAENMVAEDKSKYIMLNQFYNVANVDTHYQTTGAEIFTQLPSITHFVAGMGTGGTLMGVGKRLKEANSQVQIIGVEPNPVTTIQGLRNMTDFTPPIFDFKKLDSSLRITEDQAAFELARDLFKKEGISVGISSGAALWGAIQVAQSITQGGIVTLFPDRGDRYVSTTLFNL